MLKHIHLISALSGLLALSSACHAAPPIQPPLSLFSGEIAANGAIMPAAYSNLNFELPAQNGPLQLADNEYNLYSLNDDGDDGTAAPITQFSAATPNKAGLIKDTKYFFAYQVAIVGLLYLSPQSFSGWSDEQKDDFSFDKYKDNIRHAVWDSDQWDINYIMHPYWGSAYYVRARERGYDENSAFWYSAALSASFEFGFEAFFEEPSLQDIIVTPVAGAFLGIYFMKLRKEIRASHARGEKQVWSDSWIMALTDPLGTMNAKTDAWFMDDESSARLSPVIALPAYRASDFDTSLENRYRLTQIPVLGMQYHYRW